jgi:hypothetical protein
MKNSKSNSPTKRFIVILDEGSERYDITNAKTPEEAFIKACALAEESVKDVLDTRYEFTVYEVNASYVISPKQDIPTNLFTMKRV